jgi:hypothetical protein
MKVERKKPTNVCSEDEAVSQRLGKECEWAVQKREEGDFGYVRCARQKS